MRSRITLGLSGAAALGLASLAPQPTVMPEPRNDCPAIVFENEAPPPSNEGDRVVGNTAAWLLGAIATRCGSLAPPESFTQTTNGSQRRMTFRGQPDQILHTPQVAVTVTPNARGQFGHASVTGFSVEQLPPFAGGQPGFGFEANFDGTNWQLATPEGDIDPSLNPDEARNVLDTAGDYVQQALVRVE